MELNYKTPENFATWFLEPIGETAHAYEGYILKYGLLLAKAYHLVELGVINASPIYRKKKYLVLVYPPNEEGKRKYQYVGNKPEKVEDALEKVERYKELAAVMVQLDDICMIMGMARNRLLSFLSLADQHKCLSE